MRTFSYFSALFIFISFVYFQKIFPEENLGCSEMTGKRSEIFFKMTSTNSAKI